MAVAREEIDSGISAHATLLDPAATTLLPRGPAPRLWRRGYGHSRLSPSDPATLLITDFSREPACTIQAETSIDDALLEMACAGTDALLVERLDSVVGLVASHDIQGPRPLEVVRACGLAGRAEVRVGHLMIPWARLPVLDWKSVAASRVRDVEEWARNTRAGHALLVEELDGAEVVRGLICRRALERSLGCSL
jgi:hypothetical protein